MTRCTFGLHDWERLTQAMPVKAERDEFNDAVRVMAGARCRRCGKTELRTFYGATVTYSRSDVKDKTTLLATFRDDLEQGHYGNQLPVADLRQEQEA